MYNLSKDLLHLNKSCSKGPHEQNYGLAFKCIGITVNTLFLIATILFNSLVCFAVYKDRNLRTPSNALLVSLSIADLLVVVKFVGSIFLLSTAKGHKFHNEEHGLCVHIAPYHYTIINIIVFHLAAISIDRLLAIKWHLRYQSLVTNTRMVGAILSLWFFSTLLCIFPIFLFPEDSHEEMDDFKKILINCGETEITCKRKWFENKEKLNLSNRSWEKDIAIDTATKHLLYGLLLNFAFPFLVIVFSYSWLLKISIIHHRKINVQLPANQSTKRQEVRAANTIAMIIACFLVCFAPMFILSAVQAFARPCWKGRFLTNKLLSQLSSLSAVLNPLIYSWRNERFRNVYWKIFKLDSCRIRRRDDASSDEDRRPEA